MTTPVSNPAYLYSPARVARWIARVEECYQVKFRYWFTFVLDGQEAKWLVHSACSGKLVDHIPEGLMGRPQQVYLDSDDTWEEAIYWSVRTWELWLWRLTDRSVDRPSL